MKRIAICITIIVAIICTSVACLLHIKNCTEKISVQLDNIVLLTKDKKTDKALQLAKSAKNYWEENNVLSFAYISQEKVSEVSSSLAKIIGLIDEESEEVTAECLYLKTYISLMYHTELPVFENIF